MQATDIEAYGNSSASRAQTDTEILQLLCVLADDIVAEIAVCLIQSVAAAAAGEADEGRPIDSAFGDADGGPPGKLSSTPRSAKPTAGHRASYRRHISGLVYSICSGRPRRRTDGRTGGECRSEVVAAGVGVGGSAGAREEYMGGRADEQT